MGPPTASLRQDKRCEKAGQTILMNPKINVGVDEIG